MGICGHLMGPFPCHQAFEKIKERKEPACETRVEVRSPLCTHGVMVQCQYQDAMRSLLWGPSGSPISVDQGPVML